MRLQLPTRRRVTRAVAVLLTATAVTAALDAASADARTPAPQPPGRATFGIAPALSSAGDTSSFSYQSGPGGRYSDKAVVVNYGTTPLDLTVFATDLENDASGGVVAGNGPTGNRDAGAWVRLASPTVRVRVPASSDRRPGSVLVPFTFAVPTKAEPGDHGAALVAQLTSFRKDAAGQPIRLNQRVATRVYIRVAGALRPALAVEGLSATYHGSWKPFAKGTATVSYTVRNTGNVRLGATELASVTGGWWGGDPIAVAGPKIDLLFPGASQRLSVTVRGVTPSFTKDAKVVVTPLPPTDGQVLAIAKPVATTSFVAIPWGLLVLLAAVLLLVAAVVLLVRRERRHRRRRSASGVKSHRRGRRSPGGRVVPGGAVSMTARTAGRAGALVAVAVGLLLGVPAGPASASGLPFTDPAAQGKLGFCDAAGRPVTSGSLDAHPFVTRAVSTLAAPAQYRAEKGGKATLYAFQPREGTQPGDWSGRQLTASSYYSNSAHPMAAATELDYSLGDFLSIYPARWDGLVQLRLFLGAPNQPLQLYPYAAAVVRVKGSTWSLVDGADVDCSVGKARSTEVTNLSPQQYQAQLQAVRKQRAAATHGHATTSSGSGGARGAAASSASHGAGGTTPGGGAAGGGASGAAASAVASTSRSDDGGVSAAVWLVGGLAVLLAVGAGAAWWGRRGAPAEG